MSYKKQRSNTSEAFCNLVPSRSPLILRAMFRARALAAALALFAATTAFARDAAQIQVALRRLANVGGTLYVAAHPDDENTALFARRTSR